MEYFEFDKSNQGISQSDMYRLYAYGTKYKNCEKLNIQSIQKMR